MADPNKLDYTTSYTYYDNNLPYQVTETDGTNTFVSSASTYDGAGNLLTQATNNGVTITDYAYDDAGRKTTITVDPSGADRITAYTYTPDGYIQETTVTGVTDAAGDRGTVSDSTHTFDALGNVLTTGVVNGSNAYTTRDELDEYGRVLWSTDPLGNTAYYGYDQAGNQTSVVSPPVASTVYTAGAGAAVSTAPAETTVGYDTFGQKVESVDADGNETTYSYGLDGELTAMIAPSYTAPGASSPTASETTYQYDNDGEIQTVTDPIAYTTNSAAGETITYGYNQLGKTASEQVLDHVTGQSATTTVGYDALGRQVSVTDPTGAQTGTVYDYLGRVTQSSVIDRYTGSNDATTATYTVDDIYGTGGWLTKQSSETTGAYQTYGYDNLGEQNSATNAAGDTTTTVYDGAGRAVKTSAPDNSYSTVTYDEAGRESATGRYAATGTQVAGASYGYNNDGEATSSTVIQSSSVSPTSTYSYDAAGRLTSETEPTDGVSADAITVSYGYDPAGHQTAYTSGNGNTTYSTYNSWGLPETQVEPATGTYTNAADLTATDVYDADGDLLTQTQPGGVQLAYTYDGRGDVLGESGTGAAAPTATRTFTYDLDGRVQTAATGNTLTASASPSPSPTGTGSASNATGETYTYNDRGELLTASNTSPTTGGAGSSSFTYTGDGQMATRTDASGTTSYTYDTSSRPNQSTDASTGTSLTYSYNTNSQLSQITYGSGGNKEVLGYNTAGQLTSDTLQTTTGTAIKTLTYGYDEAGDLTSKTDAAGVANTYTYDEAGRLTSWTDQSTSGYSGTGTCTNSTTLTCYTYDQDSNRTESGTSTFTYNAQDELTGQAGASTGTYQYTAQGTLASETVGGTTTTFQDDAYGQQTTAGTGTYTYDASGRLTSVQNTAGTTSLAYSGTGNLVASDGTTTYSRTAAGALLGENTSGTSALIWTDQHTDVVGTFTATGSALTGTEQYNPLGKVLTDTGTTATLSVGYQSEWTDAATGQVNMAARWYNPANGQFTSRDTASNPATPNTAAANPFAYGNASPLDGTDTSGHMVDCPGGPCGNPGGYNIMTHRYNPEEALRQLQYEIRQDEASIAAMRQINAQKSNSALVKDKPVTIGVVTLPSDYMSAANFKTLKAQYSSMLTKVAAQYSASGSGEQRGGAQEQYDALAYVCESSNICGTNLTLLLEESHDNTAEKVLGPGLPIDVGGATGSALDSRMLSSGLSEGLDTETSSLLAHEASASLTKTSSFGDIISAYGGDTASAKTADETESAYEEAQQTVDEGKAAEADLTTELQQEKQIETQIKDETHTTDTRKTSTPTQTSTGNGQTTADGSDTKAITTAQESVTTAAAPDAPAAVVDSTLALDKAGREPPNAYGTTITSRLAQPGETFNMVVSQGQTKPGGFGTFDDIPNQAFVRDQLAIRTDWKDDVSLVQRYAFPDDGDPIRIQESIIGSQEDPVLGHLPGGASQLEILNFADRGRLVPVGDPIELPSA